MAAPKADPLPQTAQQTVQKPPLTAKKTRTAAEVSPQAVPPKQAPASPLTAKPAAPAPRDIPGGKAPKPKGRPPKPKEQRAALPEVTGAAGADTIVPIPEEVPVQPFVPDTYQSHTPEEDARVLNYRRLSHFRHRRYYSRGRSGFDSRHGGTSLWDPEANLSTKAKLLSAAEARESTQPAEYIVENYIRPPESPAESNMWSMKVICFGAWLVVAILMIAAWVVVTVRRARGLSTSSEEYDDVFGIPSNIAPFDAHRGFADVSRNRFFSTNIAVRDVSVTTEDGGPATSEAS